MRSLLATPTPQHDSWFRRHFVENCTNLLGYGVRAPTLLRPAHLSTEHLTPTTRLYGIELEVEPRKTAPRGLIDQLYSLMPNFVIVKADSSLNQGGFEIVTAPATFGAHRLGWKPFFGETRDGKVEGPAQHLRSYSTTTCGMHIHVSSISVHPYAQRRLWSLFNDPLLAKFLERVAGRPVAAGVSHYAHQQTYDFWKLFFREQSVERYGSMNLGPPDTFEIRIFQGNTNLIGFFKNLDFVDSLITFCEQTVWPSCSGYNYLRWLQLPPQRSSYRYLHSWIKRGRHAKNLLIEASAQHSDLSYDSVSTPNFYGINPSRQPNDLTKLDLKRP